MTPPSSADARRCIACEGLLSGPRCEACGAAALVRRYRVLRVIAQGELGRLYLAEDARGQRIALKELVLLSAPDDHRLQAFEREAKVLTRLSHPRVPRLFESFTEGTGTQTRLYLAQELIEGESLLARLAVHRYSEAEVRDLARKILSVLVQLHAHVPKIIHRDIKPANLIVRPDGALFLVDLGSARELATGEARGATMTGTYGYAPLEQLAGHVTEWSDLHAVGATLLHLLTRQPPWEFLQEGKGLVPDRRLDVSEGFRRFIGRLVETDAARRFTTAREALRALDQLEEPESPAAGRESPAAHEQREVKRWRWALLLLPLLAVATWALLPRPARVSEQPTPAPSTVVTPPPEPTPPPAPHGGLGVQSSELQEPSGEETGFPIHLEVDERVELASVSRPVLTFRLERVSLGGARGPERELLLEGHCDDKGTRKRCPSWVTWLHVSDEEGQASKRTATNEAHIEGSPEFGFTASVRAPARRFLITVGDPKDPDARWTFDAEARRLDVAH